MPEHMRRNWCDDLRAVGNDFYAALRRANGTIHIVADGKMLFEQGHRSIGNGRRSPFGGFAIRALAKNGERAFLPIDILRGERLPFADAQSGIKKQPDEQFVFKYQARFLEGLDLIKIERDAFILVFHRGDYSISAFAPLDHAKLSPSLHHAPRNHKDLAW